MLFPSEHLAYSPTALGLYDALAGHAEVTLHAPLPRAFDRADLGGRDVRYFPYDVGRGGQVRALPHLGWQRLAGGRSPVSRLGRADFARYRALKRALDEALREPYDEILTFDLMFLHLAVSSGRPAHLVSLELTESERPLLDDLDPSALRSVMIQSAERYHHLFPEGGVRVFLVQNAPIFTGEFETSKSPNALVLNGTALPWFGLEHCLRFVREYPDFSLTLQGAVLERERRLLETEYRNLLDEGRVRLGSGYLEAAEMIRFMGRFEAGFCFYDLSFPFIDTFNYRTAPSGKMFAYFAAGVPVVGNDIPGLKPVEEFQAGVLVPDFHPETLREALRRIQSDPGTYRNNCFRAAAHYSFDRNVAPFVDFVLGREGPPHMGSSSP